MKLLYEDLEDIIHWKIDEVPVITITNLLYRNTFIQRALNQSNLLSDSPFYLSEDSPKDKELKFETIMNVFDLNVNSVNFVNKVKRLYEELLFEDIIWLSEIQGEIHEKLYGKSLRLPVSVELEDELNIKRLLQLFDLKIVEDYDTLLEKVVNYLLVNAQLGICNYFIIINLKQYLTPEDLSILYTTIEYEEITLILIENQVPQVLEKEKHFLIDEDLCLIY